MKKNNIYRLGMKAMAAMTIVATAALTSCSDDDAQSNLTSAVVPSSITFNLSDEASQLIYTDETGAECLPLIKGESVQLAYTLKPDTATYKDVVWTTTNQEFVSVSDQGLVTAVDGDGYSIVEVAPVGLYSGSGINATLKVVVSAEMRRATGITVSSSASEVYEGDTLHFAAAIAPVNSTYKTVRWSVSDDNVASISTDGILTAKSTASLLSTVTVTATALDGSGVSGSKTISIRKIVKPESVAIDQKFSADNGYFCALNEQSLTLAYTTVPAECTTSLIQWTSSNETVATVDAGVVTFHGFGEATITATTPDGKQSSIKINVPVGLIRETYHNASHYSVYNAKQSGNGTSSSHVWHDGYITVTTYTQNATNQRADIKWWDTPVTLHAGNYPIIAIKVDDVKDMGYGITSRNLNFDVVGTSESGTSYKALGGGNNKYTNDYKCSDGSHVFIYDLSTLAFGTGGMAPTTESITFSTFQLKYADMKTVNHQVTYNIYWMQTFKTIKDVQDYITGTDGLTYDIIK